MAIAAEMVKQRDVEWVIPLGELEQTNPSGDHLRSNNLLFTGEAKSYS
jgi:hypothetical protein